MMTNCKIALCAIVKNENLYIRDWIEYHKKLGIDKIFLYDNNDINGEKLSDVINDYILSKYVVIFNRRGIEKGLVYNKNNINLQNQCYIECYNNLKDFSEFQWVFFIDLDEYINVKSGTLKEQLTDKKYNEFDTICFPWIIYDDNEQLTYKPGSLINRFPNISKYKDKLQQVKSCVRIGKDINDYNQFLLIHYILLKDEKVCYENGETVNFLPINVDINNDNNVKQYKKINYPLEKIHECNITINHYRFKTLEEYLIRQYKRHWGSTKHYTNKQRSLKQLENIFFKYNNKTQEKLLIFLKLKDFIMNGKIIVNLYYKNDKQIIKLLNTLNNQSLKPTDILIHISKDEQKLSKLNFDNYKFNIKYYYDITTPKYQENKLIKENDLKYKIILNDSTNYDDQFLKTLIIKSLFN